MTKFHERVTLSDGRMLGYAEIGDPASFIHIAKKQAPLSDQALMEQPEVMAMMLESWKENLRRGYRAYVEDASILMHDWGIDPRDIEQEVYLWWGSEDRNNPLAALHYFENTLKNSRTYLHQGEGHFNFLSRWKEVLELFKPAKSD